jgi:SAM-dependent methyltransferase
VTAFQDQLHLAARRLPGLRPTMRTLGLLRPIPEGDAGIAQVGHRRYVGGDWDLVGRQQLDLLRANGLEPTHVLLDVACGSLRAGVHLIPYLEPGHYLGIEKEATLVEAGKRDELSPSLLDERRPEFVVSASFEFERFSRRADFAIARSLFTHLPEPLIVDCMTKLRRFIHDDGVFLASFFRSRLPALNPSKPHPHQSFRYTRRQMEAFGPRTGWSAEYLGRWVDDDSQVYFRYRPARR